MSPQSFVSTITSFVFQFCAAFQFFIFNTKFRASSIVNGLSEWFFVYFFVFVLDKIKYAPFHVSQHERRRKIFGLGYIVPLYRPIIFSSQF
jgi:hypothetical protein